MESKSTLTLKGRTAVVTGGSKNIGLAIAEQFALAGMNVAILSVSKGSAVKASNLINLKGGVTIGVQCDVSDQNSVEIALKKVFQHFGSIDVLVNSAGILDMFTIDEMTVEHWDKVMSINLRGTFLMIQKSVKYFKKSRRGPGALAHIYGFDGVPVASLEWLKSYTLCRMGGHKTTL